MFMGVARCCDCGCDCSPDSWIRSSKRKYGEFESEKPFHIPELDLDLSSNAKYDLPTYDYPPLKCNLNENPDPLEADIDVDDVEKYPLTDSPHGQENLKTLERRISQMERIPSFTPSNGDVSGGRNYLEKVVVGQSPRRQRHIRRVSTGSSSSLLETTRDQRPDFSTDFPRSNGGSFKKMEDASYAEEGNSFAKGKGDSSEIGDNDMNDRVYTIDSIHHGVSHSGAADEKKSRDDTADGYGEKMNQPDLGDPDITKLYMRLQALEADRESMRQAIMSMRTEKAQMVLLKEIAQHLSKDMIIPERRLPLRKASIVGAFSFISVFKVHERDAREQHGLENDSRKDPSDTAMEMSLKHASVKQMTFSNSVGFEAHNSLFKTQKPSPLRQEMPSCKNLLLASNLRNMRRKSKSKSKRRKPLRNEGEALLPESALVEEEEEEEEDEGPGFKLKTRGTSREHGVQPLGNLYFINRGAVNERNTGLGNLQILTDELVLDILGLLGATHLGVLATVTKSFYIFANHEPLWRNLVLEELKGEFLFAGSWKSTYVAARHPKFQLPGAGKSVLKIRDFYSDYLFQSWLCANLEMKREWLERDNIVRVRGISVEDFVTKFEEPNKPVLLEGCLDDWPATEKWSKDYLTKVVGDVEFAVGPVEMKLENYFRYSDRVSEERPLYLFDPKFAEKVPVLDTEYEVPVYFREDLFSVLGNGRPDYRWIIIGPSGSGSSFHIDPNSTSAWNAVITGSKKWVLFPPDVVPPGVHPSPDGAEVACPVSIMEWFMNFYGDTKKWKKRPIECVCKAGEVMFVPNGWWHLVINLEESIAITQNYVSRRNLLNVLEFLKKPNAKELVSGTTDRENLHDKFKMAIERDYPGTIQELEKKAEEAKRAEEQKVTFWDSVSDSKAGDLPYPLKNADGRESRMSNIVLNTLRLKHPKLALLQYCSSFSNLKIIHGFLIRTHLVSDVFVASRLLTFCVDSSSFNKSTNFLGYIYGIFSQIQSPNLFVFNLLIRGFSIGAEPSRAFGFYTQMLRSCIRPDNITFPFLIKASGEMECVTTGEQTHSQIVRFGFENDVYVENSLVHMYANCGLIAAAALVDMYWRCGEIEKAISLFKELPEKDSLSWSSIIKGLALKEKRLKH
ncbi:unnamed protein product [Thlaspi arvense]|uniref:JmjC domain-containing protein n=1 Tax=Thlaspi arvense TaxID=13288 RepID=A0AAU9SVW5_THLAR|nr:unnamed protein product [Thlaspi arvense]